MVLGVIALVAQVCQTGQLCSSCTDVARPGDCHRHITCSNEEQCYHRLYTNSSGTALYELGCIVDQACKPAPVVIGKRSMAGPHFKCFACCNNTALCNQMSDCENAVSMDRQLCASCRSISNPLACNYHENCTKDGHCYIYKYVTDTGAALYDLGCMSESVCPSTNNINKAAQKRSEDKHFKCLACCEDSRMCNKHLSCDGTAVAPTFPPKLPHDCGELKLTNGQDGSYTIFPYGVSNSSITVYCRFASDGAWTVIQRRFNGSVDFYRNWTEYQRGFGNSHGEYWLGNDVIHHLTALGNYTLKILLTDWNNVSSYAEYSKFLVANATLDYMLTIGGYSGTAGDRMRYQNGMRFSTWDRDNDKDRSRNCVDVCVKSAWWLNGCCESGLNAVYSRTFEQYKHGMYWGLHGRANETMKSTTMMIQNC